MPRNEAPYIIASEKPVSDVFLRARLLAVPTPLLKVMMSVTSDLPDPTLTVQLDRAIAEVAAEPEPSLAEYFRLEREALRLQTCSLHFIYGPLQHPGYASLTTGSIPRTRMQSLARQTRGAHHARMRSLRRQELFQRGITLEVILGEQTLQPSDHIPPDLLQAQLRFLIDQLQRQPQLQLRILTTAAEPGPDPGLEGFHCYTLVYTATGMSLYREGRDPKYGTFTWLSSDPADVERGLDVWEYHQTQALSAEKSLELIQRLAARDAQA